MSGYNQEDQGKRPLKERARGSQGTGQNPPPKPGQQEDLPDQELPDKDTLDGKTQEQLRKDNVQNEEKGLIHQLPGGESG